VLDPTWNFLDPAAKPRLLGEIERELAAMFELAAEPAHWTTPTACEGWEVRDMIGHLVDVSEAYVDAFAQARSGNSARTAVGVSGMANAAFDAARAFRGIAQDEMLARLRRSTDAVMREFEALSDDEWTQLAVADPYLGPLPAMVIAEGSLGGYVVHGWDVRQGLGGPHGVSADAADLLVPFVFLLWSATADTSTVDAPYSIGIRTTGRNGGDTRCTATLEGLQCAPGEIDDCDAIIECDPGSLVLMAYNRINAGTIRGNAQLANAFRSLIVAI
jgi:uncharacterized protein (TIGR03083 family)